MASHKNGTHGFPRKLLKNYFKISGKLTLNFHKNQTLLSNFPRIPLLKILLKFLGQFSPKFPAKEFVRYLKVISDFRGNLVLEF